MTLHKLSAAACSGVRIAIMHALRLSWVRRVSMARLDDYRVQRPGETEILAHSLLHRRRTAALVSGLGMHVREMVPAKKMQMSSSWRGR
jgi:hypothetical protein